MDGDRAEWLANIALAFVSQGCSHLPDASSLPKLIGMPLAYKHLELPRLRSGLELGEFITVKSVEAGGCVCGGGGSGISKD